jgi:cytochrome c peroxidase
MSAVRKGEFLFNDAGHCFQQWQSCVSCHPADARSDGLNWDLLNDGIGNPKNSKSLLLSHETPPVMMTGIRADAETAVRAGIKYIQFASLPDADASAIDAYLKALEPVPSPYLVNGELIESAIRGKTIFGKAQCNLCHGPPLYTNKQKYEVGTGIGREKHTMFDTPTLIEVWRTAPYLHDGRAATMEEVLVEFNPEDKHGVTSNLSDEEINDLVEFILSQ